MKRIKINDKFIGEDYPTFVVVEAGCNHEGSLELAKKLVDGAVLGGADAIKFQHYEPKKLATKTVPYFWVNERDGTSQFEKWGSVLNYGYFMDNDKNLSSDIENVVLNKALREELSRKGRELVDGNGVDRIIDAIVDHNGKAA